jgi:uncharacterized protein (DUF1778 family)
MKVLQFRVTDEERALIREAAWLKRMSMQQWLHSGAVAGARSQIQKAAETTSLKGLDEPLPAPPEETQESLTTYDTPESVEELEALRGLSGKKTHEADPEVSAYLPEDTRAGRSAGWKGITGSTGPALAVASSCAADCQQFVTIDNLDSHLNEHWVAAGSPQ